MTAVFDFAALTTVLKEAAQAEILPRFRRLGTGDVRMKTEAIDLVTEADEEAERFLKARMDAIAPGALFIGEEAVSANPSLLDTISGADLVVIVDPIDGTYNFAAGMPLFGVMASVVYKGETVAGIIYDPMGDDWVLAEKGSGAFRQRPDGHREAMTVSAPVTLDNMVGVASTTFYSGEDKRMILSNLAQVRLATSYRCAAHEYRTFVAGYLHFLMYNKLMPWDHLAGVLIAQEAGGYVARLDGSAYLPHHVGGGLIAATDPDSWKTLREKIFTI